MADNAYYYNRLYLNYTDSINQLTNKEILAEAEAKYQNELLSHRNNELDWQKRQSIYIGCIVALLLLLLVIFSRCYYRLRLARKEKQVIRLKQSEQEKLLYIAQKEQEITRLNE